jgi:Flp pilus assembly protein TadD
VGAGQNLAALGQLDEAERHLAEAVRLAPEFAEAHLLHGVVLGRQGMTTVAVEEFRTALRLKPDLLDARLNLGIAMIETNPAEALAHFEAVLRQNPSNASAMRHAQDLRSAGIRAASP